MNPNLEQSANPVATGAIVGIEDSCTSTVESDVVVDDIVDEVMAIPVVEVPFSAGVKLKICTRSVKSTDRSLSVVDSLVVVFRGNGSGVGIVVSLTPVILSHTTDV